MKRRYAPPSLLRPWDCTQARCARIYPVRPLTEPTADRRTVRTESTMRRIGKLSPAGLIIWFALLVFIGCQSGQSKTVIGVVNQTPNLAVSLEGFKAGMAELGYIEGDNLIYIYRGPTDFDSLAAESERLLDQNVDLILALGTPASIAAKAAIQGTDIPVVFGPVYDPLKSGLVDDFLSPGGNLTGIRTGGHIAKIIELHLQIVPDTKHFFVPHNPADDASVQSLSELKRVTSGLGIDLTVAEVRTVEELSSALGRPPENVDSLFLLTSGFLLRNADRYMESAIANMLPISSANSGASNGMLVSYQIDQFELGKQASRMANKILLGTSPSDLPVELHEPVLGVNLLTAKALEVRVPDLVIQLAGLVVR